MTTLYVSSVDGSNSDNGTTWALAKQTVAGALSALTGTGPHLIYVDSAHNYTASAAISWVASVASQTVAIISVNRNGSTTTGHSGWLSGAKENVGAVSSGFTLAGTRAQNMYIYGCTLISGNSGSFANGVYIANDNNATRLTIDTCTIDNPTTSTSGNAGISVGTALNSAYIPVDVAFVKTTFKLRNSSASVGFTQLTGNVRFVGCSIAFSGANKPTAMFQNQIGTGISNVVFQDCDLSGYDVSSGAYINVGSLLHGKIAIVNCKLSATPTIQTGTWDANNSAYIEIINSDSSDTNNYYAFYNRLGTITRDTSVYRNKGAKFDGNNCSWKLVTTSAVSEGEPFVFPLIQRWSGNTASATFSVDVAFDNATDQTDRTLWAEFSVLESSSFPNGTTTSTRNANPFDASGVNLSSSSDDWTGTGGWTNAKKRTMSVTRTAAEKSFIMARMSAATASWTAYFDPVITITGNVNNASVVWPTNGGAINTEPLVGVFRHPGMSGGLNG